MIAVTVLAILYSCALCMGSPTCETGEHYCEDTGQCINDIYTCEGCLSFQKRCADGRCIRSYDICSREEGTQVCSPKEKKCPSSGLCVHYWLDCPQCPRGMMGCEGTPQCVDIDKLSECQGKCRFMNLKQCSDGRCVNHHEACSECSNVCSDGSCATFPFKCPEPASHKNWLYYLLMTALFGVAALSLLVKLKRGMAGSRNGTSSSRHTRVNSYPEQYPEDSPLATRAWRPSSPPLSIGVPEEDFAPPSYISAAASRPHHPGTLETNPGTNSQPFRLYSRTVPRYPEHAQPGYPSRAERSDSSSPLSTDRSVSPPTETVPGYPGSRNPASASGHPGTTNEERLPRYPGSDSETLPEYPGTTNQAPNPRYPGASDSGPVASNALLDEVPPPPYPGLPQDMPPPPSYDDVVNKT